MSQLSKSITEELNKHFKDKIFRIKSFGPAKFTHFEYNLGNLMNTNIYFLVFKSIFNNKSHKIDITGPYTTNHTKQLVTLIREIFQIVEIEDVTELDYLLFKENEKKFEGFENWGTGPTAVVDCSGRAFTIEDLNSAFNSILNLNSLNTKHVNELKNEKLEGLGSWLDNDANSNENKS